MTAPGAPRDRAAIERDIARTRDELGDTVAALSARLDVKTRIKTVVTSATETVRARIKAQPELVAIGSGVALTGVVVLVVRKVRR